MREFILEELMDGTNLDVMTIILNNVVALIAALFIMFVYKITYSGVSYSRKFNVSLGAIAITTTMIMGVISNDIALSLGMVGALSIIRLRTAIKDVRDAAFIFWAIAIGIGCGVSQYALIGVGSVFLLIFMLVTKQSVSSGQQLLIIQGKLEAQNGIETTVDKHFNGKAHRTIKNVTATSCELVYRVKEDTLKKADEKQKVDIAQRLMKVEGVIRVNLVEQQDDISR